MRGEGSRYMLLLPTLSYLVLRERRLHASTTCLKSIKTLFVFPPDGELRGSRYSEQRHRDRKTNRNSSPARAAVTLNESATVTKARLTARAVPIVMATLSCYNTVPVTSLGPHMHTPTSHLPPRSSPTSLWKSN